MTLQINAPSGGTFIGQCSSQIGYKLLEKLQHSFYSCLCLHWPCSCKHLKSLNTKLTSLKFQLTTEESRWQICTLLHCTWACRERWAVHSMQQSGNFKYCTAQQHCEGNSLRKTGKRISKNIPFCCN